MAAPNNEDLQTGDSLHDRVMSWGEIRSRNNGSQMSKQFKGYSRIGSEKSKSQPRKGSHHSS